ncbi:GtrA family protein [Clostridium tyrobutyricum]|uniref:GtrA family protein n=1 Tax=Clostridium tyrobutyricum TaxID=1519 RepID=UPI0010AA6D71|nr:GtrA family protein [Clostridium tyrobutyricum]QCH29458.1 GtrA-like protein [Clostridium tyrobutyricum]
MNRLKNIVDIKTLKFLIVGIINTLVGTFIMFSFYNLLGLNYWISSSANYILASVLSYILNKYWTFQNREKSVKIVVKFIVNILVCYLISYGVAKPLVRSFLSAAGTKIQDNVSMFVGMILFTSLNYFGQRFFAFKEQD